MIKPVSLLLGVLDTVAAGFGSRHCRDPLQLGLAATPVRSQPWSWGESDIWPVQSETQNFLRCLPHFFPGANNRSKRPGFCCQVAPVGSAEARRGAGWGDALPGVCSGSGKPVGDGPAVPRRGEQEQGTGRRQDFSLCADRIKNAYFHAVASLPLPPALPRPHHPQISCGGLSSSHEVRQEGLGAGRLAAGKECRMREPGVTGEAGQQWRGDRAPICASSTFLSGFVCLRRLPPPVSRPRGAMSTRQGRVWGSRRVSSREPEGLPRWRRACPLPHARPHLLTLSPSPTLGLDLAQPRGGKNKLGMIALRGRRVKSLFPSGVEVGKNPATLGVCSD